MTRICILCLMSIRIFVATNGDCLRVETDNAVYPCTEEIKRDTGCWDEHGKTQLCGAIWIENEAQR